MSQDLRMSRRGFLGVTAAAAGAAGAAALGKWAPSASASTTPGSGPLIVPSGHLGTQQWNARDAWAWLDQSVSGRLDEDPQAPNVPLPGGFRSVFKYLASVGYNGIEYYSFNQGANGPFTNQQLRQWQDEFGLYAMGSHTGGPTLMYDPATDGFTAYGQAQVELAHTLGMVKLGFSGNPISSLALEDQTVNGTVNIGWQTLLHYIMRTGELLKAEGIQYYWHPEEPSFQFFSDPELNRTHLVMWVYANADHRYLHFEMDTLHWWAGRLEYPDPVTGGLMENPLQVVLNDVERFNGFHFKDGNRIVPFVAPPGQPFTQVVTKTVDGISVTDAVNDGEGSIGIGYPTDPDQANPGFRSFFTQVQRAAPSYKDALQYITETDNGPGPLTGPGADPGRSLRWSRTSAEYMLKLRQTSKAQG
jgi:hypothetical protein